MPTVTLTQNAIPGTGVAPSSIKIEDARHRTDFENFVIQDAEPKHRAMLTGYYRLWHTYNQTYFNDAMTAPYIMVGVPRARVGYGGYEPITAFGGRTGIVLRASVIDAEHPHFKGGTGDAIGVQRFVEDVLLHYAVRQYCDEVLGMPDEAESGHGGTYTKECNRIGTLLNLPPVGQARKTRNPQGLPSCAEWPWCVRPAGYYNGAYAPNAVQPASSRKSGQTSANDAALIAMLQQEVARLQQQLTVVTSERNTAQRNLTVVTNERDTAYRNYQSLDMTLKRTEAERDQALNDLANLNNYPTPDTSLVDTLRTIVSQYGLELVKDTRRFSSILNDLRPIGTYAFGKDVNGITLEVNLLSTAISANVTMLSTAQAVDRLVTRHGIARPLAEWAVTTWEAVLSSLPPVIPSALPVSKSQTRGKSAAASASSVPAVF